MLKVLDVALPDTVTKEMPVYDAIKILLDNKISGAPVTKKVDGKNRLIGIISEKDYLSLLSNNAFYDQLPPGCCVENYMSTNVTSISPETDIFQVVDLFLRNVFRRLPVVDAEGTVVGIVSRRDVLTNCKKLWDEKDTRRKLKEPGKGSTLMA